MGSSGKLDEIDTDIGSSFPLQINVAVFLLRAPIWFKVKNGNIFESGFFFDVLNFEPIQFLKQLLS